MNLAIAFAIPDDQGLPSLRLFFKVFPAGSIVFDCALLMRGLEHEWHDQKDLCYRDQAPSPALHLTG